MNAADIVDIYPLSPMQEGMLFHSLYEEASGVYVIQLHCRLHGQLRLDTFKAAWQSVINRHAVLRTDFDWESADEPLQIVYRQAGVPLQTLDWRHMATAEQQKRLEKWLRQDRVVGFDLNQHPLLRLTLIRLVDDAYCFVLSVHHILVDGRSLALIVHEMLSTYEALCAGGYPQLPWSPPYRNYIAWLQNQNRDGARAFWQKMLAGVDAPTPLPIGSVGDNGETETGNFASHRVGLSSAVTDALNALARQHQLTMGTVVQGAWALLLNRYSGEKDVVYGTTVSSYPPDLPGGETTVGLFLNTLPLRATIKPDAQLVTWLQQLQAEQSEVRQYGYSSLSQVQGWSDVPAGTPLFETIFTFTNASIDRALMQEFRALEISDVHLSAKINYPIGVWVEPTGRELGIEIIYDDTRFEPASIQRLAAHYQSLLTGMAADPLQPIAALPLLSRQERDQVLLAWNNTYYAASQGGSIIDRFEEWAARTPDAAAVSFRGCCLSYEALNSRANQLAHVLRERGVGPEKVVGICVERSIELVVGILAVLKAGGAYLPLDPAYPDERLAFMLADADTAVLLTQADMKQRFEATQSQLLSLDDDWETVVSSQPQTNLAAQVTGQHLAYVIYTSGSTGRPKGVQVSHEGLLNLVNWHQRAFAVTPSDRATQIAGLAFDASVWELWPYLTAGASLHLVPDDPTRTLPEQLRDWLAAEAITISFLPTPLAEAILPLSWPATGALRTLLTGGDKLHHYPDPSLPFALVNNYGPTENAVVATSGLIRPQEQAAVPDIGRPIDNNQIYLLDAQLRPVPVGVPGELYIGGESLARGYRNRPGMTAERFIPNPFGGRPGARLYRTGDLARYRADGRIEFLGRNDEQIKIRGYRIELGEIEAVLRQHPEVQEALVLTYGETDTDKQLVAYLTPSAGTVPAAALLYQFLNGKLPNYMFPASFVSLDAFPLTPNGKVDRRRLPAPESAAASLAEGYVPPRNPIESQLVEIWSRILDVERVGIHDNFFQLGGDSILSIRVIAAARQAGLMLEAKQIFDHQTIARLAAAVNMAAPAVRAEQGLVTGPIPLTPIQSWFFDQNLPQAHHFNQAVMLEIKQALDMSLWAEAWQQVLRHHDMLRVRYQHDGSWQQIGMEAFSFGLSEVNLLPLPKEDWQAAVTAVTARAQSSLNLEEGPLIHMVRFVRGSEMPELLLIVIHHLVVDTVSWGILLADVEQAYEQLRQEQIVTLPAKTTSFKQWVETLAVYAQSETLQAEQPYWLEAPYHQAVSLPLDFPEGEKANTEAEAQKVIVSLSEEETEALLHNVPDAYRTRVNEILLMALAQAFQSWVGENSFLIDLEGHGREDHLFDEVDISRTVGWFTTIFPALLQLNAGDDLDRAIKRVKEQIRRIPNHGIGYGLLRYLSQDETAAAALSNAPQAQILFNYLGQFDRGFGASTLFAPTTQDAGVMHSPLGKRPYLLEVVGSIVGGKLRVEWTYGRNVHRRETIERVAQIFIERLRTLITFCLSPEAGGYTPSDFALASLNQSQLDTLVAGRQRPIADIYPLTPSQQGMFFHALYQPESEIYFAQTGCQLSGKLNVTAFKQSWQRLVDRHPVLRTSFVWEGLDEAMQVVYEAVPLPWIQEDWRGLSPAEQQQKWEDYLLADRRRGFELDKGPLMRIALMQLAEDSYYFSWSIHHLILDGWGPSILLQEVFTCYQSLSHGEEPLLSPARPYRDYVAWLQKQDLSEAKDYWRERLAGFGEATPLNIGRETASNGHRHYDAQEIRLSPETTTALETLTRERRLTLNTLMQGLWALFLRSYSGRDDVVFGCTVAGRPPTLEGVESIIGPFISVLPVRFRVSAEGEFLNWLAAVQEQQAAMRRHEFVSLAQIQRWRDQKSQRGLFESMYVFENATMFNPEQLAFQDFEVKLTSTYIRNNFPFTVKVVPWTSLEIHLLYEANRFTRTDIQQLLSQFRQTLEAVAENPGIQIQQLLQMLEASEQQYRLQKEQEIEASSLKKLQRVQRRAVRNVSG